MTKPRILTLAFVLTATALVSGCATDELKKELADVRAQAEQANAAATAAQRSADAAANKADAAQARADEALSTANEAKACCEANSEKIDRMFRKAMMK